MGKTVKRRDVRARLRREVRGTAANKFGLGRSTSTSHGEVAIETLPLTSVLLY
jgi:hypothetical protein